MQRVLQHNEEQRHLFLNELLRSLLISQSNTELDDVLQRALQHNEEQRRVALLRGREQSRLHAAIFKLPIKFIILCRCVCACEYKAV